MRLERRNVVIIMVERRVIGRRLRAAAGRQDDRVVIARFQRDAAAIIVRNVEMAVAAAYTGPLVLFLPGEIGGGAADARKAFALMIFVPFPVFGPNNDRIPPFTTEIAVIRPS